MTTEWLHEREDSADYEFELLVLAVAEEIADRMELQRVSRAELASRLGVSKPRITQLLSAYSNPQLKTLVEVAHALDCKISFRLSPRAARTWVRPVDLTPYKPIQPADSSRHLAAAA